MLRVKSSFNCCTRYKIVEEYISYCNLGVHCPGTVQALLDKRRNTRGKLNLSGRNKLIPAGFICWLNCFLSYSFQAVALVGFVFKKTCNSQDFRKSEHVQSLQWYAILLRLRRYTGRRNKLNHVDRYYSQSPAGGFDLLSISKMGGCVS